MGRRIGLTALLVLALPMAAQAGEGWFGHRDCPRPSYNRWNYILPKAGYEWNAYLHPVPADYRTGPYSRAGDAVPGVRWFPCSPVDPATFYGPPPPPPPPATAAPAPAAKPPEQTPTK